MKRPFTIAIFLFGSICLFGRSDLAAQTPGEQLAQLVMQLRTSTADAVLREKIIKLGASMKPSPAVPDEAIRFEGRAQYAFKSAKTEADYVGAAQEYEKAVAAAPWVLGYYSDLCTIYEKAGKPDDAKRNCTFYLVGLSDPEQITDAKRRIAGLEFAIEKANSPEAKVAKETSSFDSFLEKLDGVVFVESNFSIDSSSRDRSRFKVKISNGRAAWGIEIVAPNGSLKYPTPALGEVFSDAGRNNSPPPDSIEVVRLIGYSIALGSEAGCWDGSRTNFTRDRKLTLDKNGGFVTLSWCNDSEKHVLFKK